MKILLIWPRGYDTTYVMPISFGYLKSNANPKHEFKLLDCSLEDIPADSAKFTQVIQDFQPDVVGLSCWSPTYMEAIQAVKRSKEICPNAITILGGAHVTSYPDAAMSTGAVNYLFRGESDLSFQELLFQLEQPNPDFSKVLGLVYYDQNGKLQKNPMEIVDDLDTIQIPDYDFMNLDKYIAQGYRFNTSEKMNAPIWVTRGCPYRCGFCSAPLQNGRRIRKHSVEYMVKWIKKLYELKNIRMFNIIDDNFTFDMKYAKAFCEAMIGLKLKKLQFSTPNGIRSQRTDLDLLKLMKKAGWRYIIVAPESGSERVLKRMKKDLKPETIPPKVAEIKKAGLKVHGFFILGYPGETPTDVQKTIALIRKCRFNFFFLNNFQPLPGTPIYDELVASGEIQDGLLPENYSDGKRVYIPKDLKGFNFPKLVLREYMMLALMNPWNIPYMFKLINPKMAIRKVALNFYNMCLNWFTKSSEKNMSSFYTPPST